MKKALLTSIAVLFLATGTAHSADWELDGRRCLAGHVVGNLHIRLIDGGLYDLTTLPEHRDLDVKIDRLRIDNKDFPAQQGDDDDNKYKIFTQSLARGKRLQLFEEGKEQPIVDMPIGNGKRVANFLRKC